MSLNLVHHATSRVKQLTIKFHEKMSKWVIRSYLAAWYDLVSLRQCSLCVRFA